MKPNEWVVELLQDVSEFLDPYVDVRDGSDGQQLPNAAMEIAMRVDEAVRRLKRSNLTVRQTMGIPRMTTKQMQDAARQLDHAGMTALWEENKRLLAELDAFKKALREVLDGLGAIGRPWELEGHGIEARRAEEICELISSDLTRPNES